MKGYLIAKNIFVAEVTLKSRQNYNFEISCFALLQWKAKLETLLNFGLHFIYEKGYKNIN